MTDKENKFKSLPVSTLPEILPVLPLNGGVLLPHARLSLNLDEDRHLNLIDDVLGTPGRFIGIIQPLLDDEKKETPKLYDVGSAGRIVSFTETEEGHYLVGIQGVCRFRVKKELDVLNDYRRVHALWRDFYGDLAMPESGLFDRARLLKVLRRYFKISSIETDWDVIEEAPDGLLVDSLAMLCPLKPNEKQALLEKVDLQERADMLIAMLEIDSLFQEEPKRLC